MEPRSSTSVRYVPGRSIAEISEQYHIPPDAIIKLGSNENPLGPSPAAVRAIVEDADRISIYPDSEASDLCGAISEYTGYPRAIIPIPTFSYYGITTRSHHGTARITELRSSYQEIRTSESIHRRSYRRRQMGHGSSFSARQITRAGI